MERDPLETGLRASSLEQRHHQLATDAMPAPLLRDIYTPNKSLVPEFFALFADEAGNSHERTLGERAHYEVGAMAQAHADVLDAGGLELDYGRTERIRLALERLEPQRPPSFGVVLGGNANLHRQRQAPGFRNARMY